MEQDVERGIERKYLSVRDAERYTGLSRWTLARARDRGELPAVVVGRAVRYSVVDLDRFMRAQKV